MDKSKEKNRSDVPKGGHENLGGIVERLLVGSNNRGIRKNARKPLPSQEEIVEVIYMLRSIIFPKCFGPEDVDASSLSFHLGSILDQVFHTLKEQLHRGFCFRCDGLKMDCEGCEEKAIVAADAFLERIPEIAELINTDVYATYVGDPAAIDETEVILCYPGLLATLAYRVAHVLHDLGFPVISRIITEHAHSKTGIDIHPGAQIGPGFMIDHGTGVVIGETCEIGKNVRIYQSVTLGAKSFPLDEDGNPIKGIKRHPKLEDDVIIYSGATLLGDICIGEGSVIGGNVWLTESVSPGTHIVQGRFTSERFINGGGI